MRRFGLAGVVLLSVANSATAADWPCVQRKVEDIALAAVWTGPPLDAAARAWRNDAQIAGLVERLAARRTSEDDARKAIAGLAKPQLLALTAGLVETVNAERADVIAGLERFGVAQKQLATALREENARLAALRADPQADPAQLAQLTESLTWNLRIFEERRKSLRFVCEVPVSIEQRLFALSREIQKALPEQ